MTLRKGNGIQTEAPKPAVLRILHVHQQRLMRQQPADEYSMQQRDRDLHEVEQFIAWVEQQPGDTAPISMAQQRYWTAEDWNNQPREFTGDMS